MFQLNPFKTFAILATVLAGLLFSLPNALDEDARKKIPSFLPSSAMVLGLDLQGGAHLVLEVDKPKFKAELIKGLVSDMRYVMRSEAKVRYVGLGKKSPDSAGLQVREAADVEKARSALQRLAANSQSGDLGAQILGLGGGQQANLYNMEVDGQKITFTFNEAGLNARIGTAIGSMLRILSDRINALGTTEPTIQRQGVDRILVQVPGLTDPRQLKEVLGKTAKLNFQLECDSQPTAADQRPPLDCESYPQQNGQGAFWVKSSKKDTVSGALLVDAQPGFDSRNGEPIVNFRFNTKGSLEFGRLTSENVQRRFAIILDGEVVSAPVIQTAITGGSGQISGNFTVDSAKTLAIVLRSGALPAELTIVEERTVGAGLGADAVRAGFLAGILGLVLILLFMVLVYGLFGFFADVALLANLAMLIGIMSGLGATLTLPGIAGIVLTMGMAVDSNVLVFERIREEVSAGRGPLNSIETGFQRALGTILDANITTFIAAVVLFAMGSGPIKGFAVTLGIGIMTTVFTAFTLTRLIVAFWVHKTRPKTIAI